MSGNANDQQIDFESVKTRLAEIADAVDDENLSLDEALGLYEEAVALGLKASDLLETGIVPPAEEEAEAEGATAEGTGSSSDNAAETAGQATNQA